MKGSLFDTLLPAVILIAWGCGGNTAVDTGSQTAGGGSGLSPPIVIWKGGKLGPAIKYFTSCGPGDTDFANHGGDDTAALHLLPDPVITPDVCVDFSFSAPADLRAYAHGAVRFTLRSSADQRVEVGSAKKMPGGSSGLAAAKLTELGFPPSAAAFHAVIVPIDKLRNPDTAKYADVDLANVVKVGVTSEASGAELWIENVRVTAD